MAKRLQAMGQANYVNGFELTIHHHMLELPLGWRKPRFIFVNSMSDLFHEEVPEEFVLRVFEVMRRASWHIFQVLTKRADRLAKLSRRITWPDNVWMGVSIERADYTFRIDDLRQIEARVRFLSIEPLLGPIPNLNLEGVDWVIVGGESGPGARPMRKSWVRDIRGQCRKSGVPFFFKQWGGVFKNRMGRELDGRTWDEMPQRNRHSQGRVSLRLLEAVS
jgi:protein gp37